MPTSVPPETIARIRAATAATGVALAALSRHLQHVHPDPAVRADGRRRLAVVIEAAAELGIPLVTLCTGTRDPDDQWRHHPDNGDPSAWADMAAEIAAALEPRTPTMSSSASSPSPPTSSPPPATRGA